MNDTKPVVALQDTNWLTDARDAEPGMSVVHADGSETHRSKIKRVDEDVIWTENGQISAELINTVRSVVVE